MLLNLNKNWEMREAGGDWLKVNLPCCNYLELIKNNVIADPFYGTYEAGALDVSKKDYEFKKQFSVEKNLFECEHIYLKCDRLDTLADIYINDKLVANTDNCHIAYEFDVKLYLIKGKNLLSIIIHSPVNYISKKQQAEPMPKNMNGISGVPYIRKPQCHFGWDWGPTLPPSGIGDVKLEGYNKGRFDDIKIIQKHTDGKVLLNFDIKTEDYLPFSKSIKVEIVSPEGNKKTFEYPSVTEISIDNPELWWSNGLGKQALYTINFSLSDGESVLDKQTKKIGLRTIKLLRNKDEYGENFCFEVNGVKIFAKGANWIPPDSFSARVTPEILEYYISAMATSNMNMVRVWGGGYYESDVFYDLCDKYGILVWQDFAFACAPYPFYNKPFLQNVKEEIEYNVKRLRHRASLALYCGNNEIEMMSLLWHSFKDLTEWTEIFFYDILPKEITKQDDVTPYIAGTPNGLGYMKAVNSDKAGDSHLWHVWHGLRPLTYYRKRFSRFCSEFGLESLPSMDAIKSFTDEQNLSLKSDVFLAHQKCASGNNKMLYYMATRYNIPNDFSDLVYFTGLIQNECVSDATEHWRRNTGRCNGSLFWQLNDCWPVSSWSSIDYTGKFKALQYRAKHFNNPTMVSLNNNGSKISVFVINDRNKPLGLKLQTKLVAFNGESLYDNTSDIEIGAVEASRIFDINCTKYAKGKQLKNSVFVARLYDGEMLISEKTALFKAEKNLKLPKEKIEYTVKKEGEFISITLKSKAYARAVMLDISGLNTPLSDNYFDLLPNEEKTVTVKTTLTAEEVEKLLCVKDVANVEVNRSKLNNLKLRAKIFLIPQNFAGFIGYHFV